MASWERDPVVRRRVSWLLAGAEAAALTLNAYFVIAAYLRRLIVAVDENLLSHTAFAAVVLTLTGISLVVAVVQGVLYVRGRPWVRVAFLVENIALIVLGLLWFVHSIAGRGEPDKWATWGGLILPLVMLFPLLWPLLSFRPLGPQGRSV